MSSICKESFYTQWQIDKELQKFLQTCAEQALPTNVILTLVKNHFPAYKWSDTTLLQRSQHFGINLQPQTSNKTDDLQAATMAYQV